jgi:hypothetical protein
MNAMEFKVDEKRGDYIRATLASVGYSEEEEFDLVDGTIVLFLLACVIGLIYMTVA